MIKWRNRSVDSLSRAELLLALEDAAEEVMKMRTGSPDGLWLGLKAGFFAGAITVGTAALLAVAFS